MLTICPMRGRQRQHRAIRWGSRPLAIMPRWLQHWVSTLQRQRIRIGLVTTHGVIVTTRQELVRTPTLIQAWGVAREPLNIRREGQTSKDCDLWTCLWNLLAAGCSRYPSSLWGGVRVLFIGMSSQPPLVFRATALPLIQAMSMALIGQVRCVVSLKSKSHRTGAFPSCTH